MLKTDIVGELIIWIRRSDNNIGEVLASLIREGICQSSNIIWYENLLNSAVDYKPINDQPAEIIGFPLFCLFTPTWLTSNFNGLVS